MRILLVEFALSCGIFLLAHWALMGWALNEWYY